MDINNKKIIDMATNSKKYYEANKEHMREYQKEYYEANKERILEYNRNMRKSEIQKEKHRERQKKYYEANKDKILVKQRAKASRKPKAIKKEKIIDTITKNKKPLKTLKMVNKHYINKDELYYEVYICIGRGFISNKLFNYFHLIAEKISTKLYNSEDIIYDQKMEAFLKLCERWNTVNCERYNDVFPFLSEIAKRAMTEHYNIVILGSKSGYGGVKQVRISDHL